MPEYFHIMSFFTLFRQCSSFVIYLVLCIVILNISRNGSVWLIVLAYALPTGILGVWQSVLDVNLKPLGISQTTAGYMGFWQTLAGCTAGLVIAR